jgi:hypothetical protein
MKKIILLIAVSAILFLGVAEVNAQVFQENSGKNIDYKPLPNGDGLMQRLRNRICDTLGICQGGVNLTTITGELTYDGINFYIDDVELHFGPTWFIASAESSVDYDSDGELELVYDEIQGLVGTEITVEGHLQSSGWMSVFTINGEVYREPGQPIWASQHQWRWRNKNGPNKP